MANKTKTTKRATGTAQYEVPWDGVTVAAALFEVPEPALSYPEVTATDRLRASIAEDRPGTWFQLRTYRPMPKRAALSVAASWRKANPARFGQSGQHFEARIAPVEKDGTLAAAPLVTPETQYAVVVRYPAAVPDAPTTPPATDPWTTGESEETSHE